ncbi:MAG: electron transfer flavoprotein subunit alpha/FixB family protein [Oscillospiraceae bacterium]|nr:electron transfer flavoprotein subunit alpha/FixB family protein [Oscillospiraceae bacterium]
MSRGICIYAENTDQTLAPSVIELVTAARKIKDVTGESIQALLVTEKCESLKLQLEAIAVDEIFIVETNRPCMFQDDAMSKVIAGALKRLEPSCVLIPATSTGRSLFARVAVMVCAGLTADCSELSVAKNDTGSFFIRQIKPSVRENEMVSIVTRSGVYPQMLTIRQGVYPPSKESPVRKPKITIFNDIDIPPSSIEILDAIPLSEPPESLTAAEVVVVAGRGSLDPDNFALIQKFASKIGGVIAGTRPLADEGIFPFEKQIGQTGCTIRPAICVSFGVSGAIQHVEGIKDTKLFIAVNIDEYAPIFNVADYGVIGDIKEILPFAVL